ncbi:hypothetical protein LDJ94_03655 [Fusobacterium nucleatum]|uniref:hypothetical protein n=2 Tax=Fusobacterium nucleatum TaxID=851 RepID=UPI0030D5A8AC
MLRGVLKMEERILKKLSGQFYTISNPFKNNYFFKWYKNMLNSYNEQNLEFLEPFAGTNNIIKLIEELNLPQPSNWKCYDIKEPETNKTPEYKIEPKDTLKDFPKGYKVAITNPPYLAKNKATSLNSNNFDYSYDDLYLKSLDLMLKNVDFIAAIIPESFITSGKYQSRLYCIISLEMKMFNDTEVPVCLALFNKEETEDFFIVKNNINVGMYKNLQEYLIEFNSGINWKFNDEKGNIGLYAVDNTDKESIKFVKGSEIKNEIKISSRAITKISGCDFKNDKELEAFIKKANKNLEKYRNETNDIFMTSFKGLRKDFKYRRRLDYKTARNILNKTYIEIFGENYE